MADRTYLTVPEAARLLGLHRATVVDMVANGKHAAYRPGGPRGRYRVRTADFRVYLEQLGLTAEERVAMEADLTELLGGQGTAPTA